MIVAVCPLMLLAAVACQARDLPSPEALLLTEDELPGEWVISEEGPHAPTGEAPLGEGSGALRSIIVFFYHDVGNGSAGAHEQILLFRSRREATEGLRDILDRAFAENRDWRWVSNATLTETAPNASEGMLQCTEGRAESMCRMVVRYEEYVVDLKVDLQGLNSRLEPIPVMTYEELLEVVRGVDLKMANASHN